MSSYREMKCEACRPGAPPATAEEIEAFRDEHPDWELVTTGGVSEMRRVFTFKDFAGAIAFTVEVGELAEAENHHPAILTEWGRVTVRWWTHKIGGVHRNDLIAAAKTDALLAG